MAINLTSEYQKKVAERFAAASKTDTGAGKDYTFSGVNEITIYSIDTVSNGDYTRSGTARFGNLTELGDTKQTLTLSKDRCFTFSIDAGNAAQQYNIKQANACLKRQWDEVCTPEVDKYRLAQWAAGHGLTGANAVLSNAGSEAALSKTNIVEAIFTASAAMSDENVPLAGRTVYISELDYVKFKLADQVMVGNDMTAEVIAKGYKGTIDGIAVVTVPSTYMPNKVGFIIKVKGATVDPVQLKNLRVQKNPMGVDGDVVEGRFIYDSFVLDSKCKGVYVYKTQA